MLLLHPAFQLPPNILPRHPQKGLRPGICLTTEENAQKNLSQGSRRVPVGTMKTYLKHNYNSHSSISLCTDWSNEADFKDSEYFISKDFDSDYAELMNVL